MSVILFSNSDVRVSNHQVQALRGVMQLHSLQYVFLPVSHAPNGARSSSSGFT